MNRNMRMATAVRALAAIGLVTMMTVLVGQVPAHADTVRGLAWHLDYLHIAQAHKVSQGAGVVVAVIDTGVDASHPDLQGQVLPGTGEDTDAAPDGRSDSDTVHGHGTGVASLIAGKGGGDMRLLGIAPKAKILPISNGAESMSDETDRAIRWAAHHGAKVINISLAGRGPASEDERQAIQYALSKDVVVVAGAGNVPVNGVNVGMPANIPGVIAVSSVDKSGKLWTESSQGPEVVVAAPGVRVITSAPHSASDNGYLVRDGTSLAAPIVAGEAALIRAKFPTLDAANVVNRIIRTARDAGQPGRDSQFGFGIVDPLAALTADIPAVTTNPLLQPAGVPSATAGSARPTHDAGPAVEITNWNWARFAVCVSVVVAVVAAIVVLIVLLARQSSRRAAARRAASQPVPPSGWGHPPGYGQPANYSVPPVQRPPGQWTSASGWKNH
jgi:type VII secretion-associated serine protease mycosin